MLDPLTKCMQEGNSIKRLWMLFKTTIDFYYGVKWDWFLVHVSVFVEVGFEKQIWSSFTAVDFCIHLCNMHPLLQISRLQCMICRISGKGSIHHYMYMYASQYVSHTSSADLFWCIKIYVHIDINYINKKNIAAFCIQTW